MKGFVSALTLLLVIGLCSLLLGFVLALIGFPIWLIIIIGFLFGGYFSPILFGKIIKGR